MILESFIVIVHKWVPVLLFFKAHNPWPSSPNSLLKFSFPSALFYSTHVNSIPDSPPHPYAENPLPALIRHSNLLYTQKDTHTHTHTHKHTQHRERQRDRQRQRDRETETERNRERQEERETERERQRQWDRKRDRERERERQRHRERQTQVERHRERNRQVHLSTT